MTTDWQQTALWAALTGRERTSSLIPSLQLAMPLIQRVLASALTSPSDFTLHDQDHSYRVAEWMAKLIPADVFVQLSDYELALLLLSSYLHDIGMTPERSRIVHLRQYLQSERAGEGSSLSNEEISRLEKWLYVTGYEAVVPRGRRKSRTVDPLKLDEILGHYCRASHNEWGAEWIRTYLSSYQLGAYKDWLDDLILLCQSHHMGYLEITDERFSPRIVGGSSAAEIVHLRYLAVVLRIADILDFDPERTPEVIYRQRDIAPGSRIYWWKDHHISIIKEDNRIIISARPTGARIHRAIDLMLDDIDGELTLVRRLADDTHFDKCQGIRNPLPHRWDLSPVVHRDVRARDNMYEYIDGSFRPNTEKLLQLLSGTQLYSRSLDAVRELLQNAFDAVRERVAYQRLAQPNSEDPQLDLK